MTLFTLFVLAAGLCFDTFAVSLTGGINDRPTLPTLLRITSALAVSQTVMLIAGWLLGASVMPYIAAFDHWVAFVLLTFIGGKMIRESFRPGAPAATLSHTAVLLIVALATSIDAVAVGISLACVGLSPSGLFLCAAMVFVITAIAAVAGLLSGQRLGARIGKRAELLGGILLIAIGVRILLSHLL